MDLLTKTKKRRLFEWWQGGNGFSSGTNTNWVNTAKASRAKRIG
jgi:hypothetical protein